MKFYARTYKDDFIRCNIAISAPNSTAFRLSWFKGQNVARLVPGAPDYTYPDTPTVTDSITREKILTEKKTNLPLDNPHQVIACGVSEEAGNFVFVDVLKYTYTTKGTTGFFKNASNIQPIMYILVPFADSSMDDWTFVAIGNSVKVNGTEVTDTFDVDIDKSLAETCNENLPGITLSKDGTTITAQLTNSTGTPVAKSNIDIYFETTAGYLTKSRSTTDSNGVATTQVIGAEEGKVKAGFKYFSGKTQITI